MKNCASSIFWKNEEHVAGKVVWHLLSNRWNSAITEYALSAASALVKRGHRSIFSPLANSLAEGRAKAKGLEIRSVSDFSLKNLGELRRIDRELEAEVCILYGGSETFLARFLNVKNKIRFFGQDLRGFYKTPGVFNLSFSHITKFLTPNAIIENQLKTFKKNFANIPLGLEEKAFDSCSAAIRNQEIVILGRLDPIKGHEKAVRIFALLKKRWPSDRISPVLHIIGEKANLSQTDLINYIDKYQLKIGKDVLITEERVQNIYKVLGQAAIGWVPSLGSEHICRVAEEFLLVGTPIFVSGAGATEEVLFNDAGQSYRNKTDDEAAQQLVDFIIQSQGQSVQQRIGRVESAKTLFSLETMGKKLERFIF